MKIKSFTPLIAVFGTSFLITITLLKSFQIFMGISICLLAMLKLMDIEAFGTSYKKYDLISSQFDSWIYIYPFFELLLLLSFIPLLNILNTFVIKPAGFFNKVIYFIFAKSYLTMFK